MKPRTRHTLLLCIAAILACVAVWRNYDYHRQARLDGLGGRLHDAVQRGDVEAVRLLLEQGAPVDSTLRGCMLTPLADSPSTPLFRLTLEGDNPEIVRLLAAQGANLNWQPSWAGDSTPLINATIRCRTNMVCALLEAGADADFTAQPDGVTALMAASGRKGNVGIMQMLVAHGADVNAATSNGLTPLTVAANHGDTNIVALLIEYGATTNVPPGGP
jgi:ankyrin repeat protein